MTHTFLFQAGVWATRGHYIDDLDRILPLEGMVSITHLEGMWLSEGETEIKMGEKPIKIYSRYEIVPPEEGKSQLRWESLNPELGPLLGHFSVVDDTIISMCRSKKGEYTGAEFYIKVSETHYRSRGALFKGDDKLSSWRVDLQRK